VAADRTARGLTAEIRSVMARELGRPGSTAASMAAAVAACLTSKNITRGDGERAAVAACLRKISAAAEAATGPLDFGPGEHQERP
jgi:hypothetical protein